VVCSEKESIAESLTKLQAEEAVLKSKLDESKSAKEAIEEQASMNFTYSVLDINGKFNKMQTF